LQCAHPGNGLAPTILNLNKDQCVKPIFGYSSPINEYAGLNIFKIAKIQSLRILILFKKFGMSKKIIFDYEDQP
jgi:hypothetical protein